MTLGNHVIFLITRDKVKDRRLEKNAYDRQEPNKRIFVVNNIHTNHQTKEAYYGKEKDFDARR